LLVSTPQHSQGTNVADAPCVLSVGFLQTLPEREARAIIAQVFAGLAHLNRGDESADHSGPRVIHYDLKPANILFDSLGTVKITDFGLSKVRLLCCVPCVCAPPMTNRSARLQEHTGSAMPTTVCCCSECVEALQLSLCCDVSHLYTWINTCLYATYHILPLHPNAS
jgi:serine/threonine protein kinase